MNSEQILDQIRQIKEQYESQVTGKHKQWPRAIKDRVVALADSGMKIQVISDRTGISRHTVASWTAKLARRKFQEITVSQRPRGRPPKALNVKHRNRTDARKIATITNRQIHRRRNGTITMVTPTGYKVEGLNVADLLEFFKKIGGSR